MESKSLTLMWDTVPCFNYSGPITRYRLNYTLSNSSFTVNKNLELKDTTHELTGLTPFTDYSVQFHVAAININGTGPYADKVFTVVTLQDGELAHYDYRIARNFGGQNFGECPRFCVWRLIFWRPTPGLRIAVRFWRLIFWRMVDDSQICQNFSPPKYLAVCYTHFTYYSSWSSV